MPQITIGDVTGITQIDVNNTSLLAQDDSQLNTLTTAVSSFMKAGWDGKSVFSDKSVPLVRKAA